MGCGCAVIASDLPGVRDVVQHGVTGWLTPPGGMTALATAIAMLVQRPRLCRSLAQAGRHRAVQQFDWQKVSARYTECYLAALKQTTSTGPGTGTSCRAA